MKAVNIHDAKTQFSKLIQRVESGESIVISRAGRPVARLVPEVKPELPRKLGEDTGQIWMSEDFDAPLPPEILAGFMGGTDKDE